MRPHTIAPTFSAQHIEALARILADTSNGLTGTEVEYLLRDCSIEDTDPSLTKWRRLFNALVNWQNKHQMGNHILVFINKAMSPASHLRNPDRFEAWQKNLNQVLSLVGMRVNDEGKVCNAPKATTNEAVSRANQFKRKLEQRVVHNDVIKHCLSEIESENYFHAVDEAMKSVTVKVRSISGPDADGSALFDQAFSGTTPLVAINDLSTETLRGEQRGFLNLLKGLFGTVRNPISHEAKIQWSMSEQDALDIMTSVSLIHRKLDKAVKTSGN